MPAAPPRGASDTEGCLPFRFFSRFIFYYVPDTPLLFAVDVDCCFFAVVAAVAADMLIFSLPSSDMLLAER
jgi:hypothetical protein